MSIHALSDQWQEWAVRFAQTLKVAPEGASFVAASSQGRNFRFVAQPGEQVRARIRPSLTDEDLAKTYGELGIARLESLGFSIGRPMGRGGRAVTIEMPRDDAEAVVVAAATVMEQLWGIADPAELLDEPTARADGSATQGILPTGPVGDTTGELKSGVEIDLGKDVGILRLPTPWQPLADIPDLPRGTQVAGLITETCQAMVFVRRVLQFPWMPLDTSTITASIAKLLGEDVGLLDVGVDQTASGIPYAYTLVKAKMEPSGLNFNVTLHLHAASRLEIDAFFTEIGTTGVREALVWESAMREGRIRPSKRYEYAIHDADTGASIRSADRDELRDWAISHSDGKSHHSVLGLIDPDEAVADHAFAILASLTRQNYGVTVERFALAASGGFEGWTVDPHGIGGAFLPNLADGVEYDEKFREHALAEARAFVRSIRAVEGSTPLPDPEPELSPAWQRWVEEMCETIYAFDQGVIGTIVTSDSQGRERGFLVAKPLKEDVNLTLEPYEDGLTFLRSYGEQGQARLEAIGFKFGSPAPDGWRGIGINVSWTQTRRAVVAAARVMAELWEVSDPKGRVTLHRKGEFECPTCGGPLTVYPSKGAARGRQDRYTCSPGGFTHVPVGWSPGTDDSPGRTR